MAMSRQLPGRFSVVMDHLAHAPLFSFFYCQIGHCESEHLEVIDNIRIIGKRRQCERLCGQSWGRWEKERHIDGRSWIPLGFSRCYSYLGKLVARLIFAFVL